MNGSSRVPRLLLVDNRDSFTYNVAHLFGRLGADVTVIRNDDQSLAPETVHRSDGVVIGPGPGRPSGAGKTMDALTWALAASKPVFGVCLGAQAMGEFFGGSLAHAPFLRHGKVSRIEHDATGVFRGVSSPFEATRYHSLCLSSSDFPSALRVNAVSEDGVIQGIAHETLPFHAVQFHPESVLTTEGATIFGNFLRMLSQ